ncbi:MAG: 2-isopropylmalate synthase [Bacteroidales bacterium]|nr:2-isopropylmalate synthase [Bacteroidales bacterium]
MDTTLRDGEQTTGVSFTANEKLSMAKLLLTDLKMDFVEVASARVSNGEFEAVKNITSWAKQNGYLDQVEILGFVDGNKSLEWIESAGAKVINLLCKGSLKHLEGQLRKTPEEHVSDIKTLVAKAQKMGIRVNIYLEDWSNGMRESQAYVLFLLNQLKDEPIVRFMLPDTLGVLNPHETAMYCKMMVEKFPNLSFDFHAHNDYDLAVANVIEAIKAGFNCVHTTVNGLGERAGNAPISSVVAVIKDHLKMKTSIDERRLNQVSKLVESFSGIRIPSNKPLIGEFVFTQCSGVHADGDSKGNLYQNTLKPERFGRETSYALGKTSGKSNISKNLETLGLKLDPESLKRVTDKVIELGDLKETVTIDDLPYIVSDVLRSDPLSQKIKIKKYVISLSKGLSPSASVMIEINNEKFEAYSEGDGQYDAFMKAVKKIFVQRNKPLPKLLDYSVSIPPGGNTDALVETVITWKLYREFKTKGLETDQTTAAIMATEKMLNLLENSYDFEYKSA